MSARSSCWPWISTSARPSVRSVCTLTGWSLTKARVRPSAIWTRRRMRSPSASMSPARAASRAGWSSGRSKTAVTCPWSAPSRTSEPSPRAPRASEKASSRMDLPAPVSPVNTVMPRPRSRSSRSIRTMSRIESWTSTDDASPSSARHRRGCRCPVFKTTGGGSGCQGLKRASRRAGEPGYNIRQTFSPP